jgi:hypothetical protein
MIIQVNMGKIHQPADVPDNEPMLEGKRLLILIPIVRNTEIVKKVDIILEINIPRRV